MSATSTDPNLPTTSARGSDPGAADGPAGASRSATSSRVPDPGADDRPSNSGAVPGSTEPTASPDKSTLASEAEVSAKIASTKEYGDLVLIGNEEFDADRPSLAIAAYEKALKLHPFDPDVQTDLGVMYRRVHRHDEAINAFRKAAQLDPKHQESRYNLAVVLEEDERDASAALTAWKDYLKVAKPGPKTEDAKRRVAALAAR